MCIHELAYGVGLQEQLNKPPVQLINCMLCGTTRLLNQQYVSERKYILTRRPNEEGEFNWTRCPLYRLQVPQETQEGVDRV